jgi:hypothetical protein
MKRALSVAVAGAIALILGACNPAPVGTTVGPVTFEAPDFTLGNIDGQQGWEKDGPYDVEVDDAAASTADPTSFGFGEQALRISNGVASGAFGDQTFAPGTKDHAGETTASTDLVANDGVRRGYFQSSWKFASAGNPAGPPQDGLLVSASPDRGDGSRMSYVGMSESTANGLAVNFFEYDTDAAGGDGDFVSQNVATNLDRSKAHTIELRMWFFEGVDNDVVQVCVDGTSCVTGHSWEDYFREVEERAVPSVDTMLFRAGGTGVPSTSGNGFFIDGYTAKAQNYDGANVKISGPGQIVEGDSGTTETTYTLTLSEALPFTVTVPYSTSDGTATAPSDYTSASGSAVFAPGETTKTFTVSTNGDTSDETHENFVIDLGQPVSSNAGAQSDQFVFRFDSSKSISLRDDDSTVRVSDAPDTTEPDPANETVNAPFTITLDNASAVPVTVDVDTRSGSAVEGQDFVNKTTTVTFAPGQISKTVNVKVKGDSVVEDDESFVLRITGTTNAGIGRLRGFGVILDADS